MSRGAWLIIAGVLLLGHTPALAKPSLLIIKKGGVYYISNREQPQANQAGRHTASLQVASLQLPGQAQFFRGPDLHLSDGSIPQSAAQVN